MKTLRQEGWEAAARGAEEQRDRAIDQRDELLAALQQAVDAIEAAERLAAWQNASNHSFSPTIVASLRAAIQKATT